MLTGQPKNLVIDPATAADADHFAAAAPWARADEWRLGGSSLVAKFGAKPVGIAASATNRVHPTRDPVNVFVREQFRRQGIGSALVKSIQRRRWMPLSVKAHPGTVAHEFYRSLCAIKCVRPSRSIPRVLKCAFGQTKTALATSTQEIE